MDTDGTESECHGLCPSLGHLQNGGRTLPPEPVLWVPSSACGRSRRLFQPEPPLMLHTNGTGAGRPCLVLPDLLTGQEGKENKTSQPRSRRTPCIFKLPCTWKTLTLMKSRNHNLPGDHTQAQPGDARHGGPPHGEDPSPPRPPPVHLEPLRARAETYFILFSTHKLYFGVREAAPLVVN